MKKCRFLDKVIVCGLMLFVVSLFSLSAMAASYTTTLSCKTGYRGSVRSYSGSNINLSMTVSNESTYPYDVKTDDKTVVSLYREGFMWSQNFVSSKNYPRNGYQSSRWDGVGSGNYCFGFTKPCNNVNDQFNWIKSNDVKMFN